MSCTEVLAEEMKVFRDAMVVSASVIGVMASAAAIC